MSATLEERRENWSRLLESWRRPGMEVAAVEHWCGAITSLSESDAEDGMAMYVCSGCRTVLDARDRGSGEAAELSPLYRLPSEGPLARTPQAVDYEQALFHAKQAALHARDAKKRPEVKAAHAAEAQAWASVALLLEDR